MSSRTASALKNESAKAGKTVSPNTSLQTRKPPGSLRENIIFLQRTAGNRAVGRMLSEGLIQTKLTIGKPGDRYEREADSVADRVMKMEVKTGDRGQGTGSDRSNDTAQPKPATLNFSTFAQRQPEEEEKEETPVQEKPDFEQTAPLVQSKTKTEDQKEEDEIQPAFEGAPVPFLQRQADDKEEEPENDSTVQAKSLTGAFPFIQLQEEAEDKEEEGLEAQAKPSADHMPPLIQKQEEEKAEEEENKAVQTKPSLTGIGPQIQRQTEDKEDEEEEQGTLQEKSGQMQKEEEKEEPVEAQPLMRKEEEEEKELVQAKFGPYESTAIQKLEEEEEPSEEEGPVQAKAAEGSTGATSTIQGHLFRSRGGGSPMPENTRSDMESRFGMDFSNVRLHTDSRANEMARGLNAQAFTSGRDIYFGAGRYSPDTTSGQRLMAHELTHVIQQGEGTRRKGMNISPSTSRIQRKWSLDPRKWRATKWAKGKLKKGYNLAKRGAKAVYGVFKRGFDWVWGKIKKHVGKIPGYKLLTVVIGKDLVTGKKVPPTAINFARGLLGETLSKKLIDSGALAEAYDFLVKQVKKLNISFSAIWTMVKNTGKYLLKRPWMIAAPYAAIWKNFKPFIKRIWNFIKSVGSKILEFVFKGALNLLGAPVKTIMGIINKGKDIIGRIIKDPAGFARNLFAAVKAGLRLFIKNFPTHFKKAIFGWLFGTFEGTEIKLPEKFDLPGTFSFVMQVLGLTWQSIRARIVKKLGPRGEQIMSGIEKGVEIVKLLITKGPIALWEKVKESLGNLKDMIKEKVLSFVKNAVIVAAIEKVISMLSGPIGAIVQTVKAIYNIIMFFYERWNQITSLVSAIFNSIGSIAYGKVQKAAQWIEKVMGRGLTVIISFLARLVLGGIAKKIRSVIKKIREPIDKAVDKVVNWIVKKGKALFKKGKAAVKKSARKVKAAIKKFFFPKHRFAAGGKTHTLSVKKKGSNLSLQIASTPQSIKSFLKEYTKNLSPAKEEHLKNALNCVKKFDGTFKKAESILKQLEKLDLTKNNDKKKADKLTKQNQKLLDSLLEKEKELSSHIRLLMKGTKSSDKDVEKYKLEGMVGTYGSMPRQTKDRMTPDHQPQAAILKYSLELNCFEGKRGDKLRAWVGGGHARNAKAINLHEIRHEAGRTFGSKGSGTKEGFINAVKSSKLHTKARTDKAAAEKREGVIKIIRDHLYQDVAAMKKVANSKSKNIWGDIRSNKLELDSNPKKNKDKKKKLENKTRSQILSGENTIASQNLDSLK